MVFITSWNLNSFVSRALNPKLLDIDFPPNLYSNKTKASFNRVTQNKRGYIFSILSSKQHSISLSHTHTGLILYIIYQNASGLLDATASRLEKYVTGSEMGLSGKLN